jgi:signal transduction histidine kinase
MTLYSRVMRPWKDLATPRRVDLLIAAGLLVWGLPDVPWWWEYPGHAGSTPDVLGSLALTLAMSVPFCWRRVAPVPVLGLAVGVLAARYALHRDLTSAFAAVLVGAYGLGAYASPVRRYARWLGWLSLAAAVVVVVTSNGAGNKPYGGVLEGRFAGAPLALLGAAFVLGDAADARRREAAAMVEAAHQAERTRIARELHDVVAHQLSAIAVQAGAARIAAGSSQVRAGSTAALGRGGQGPDAVGQAPGDVGQAFGGDDQAPERGQACVGGQAAVLATVERLAREALTELNHLLGALRRESADDPARRPSPTLAELETLLDAARAAGVPADLTVEGGPRVLSPGVELSCYRIIDEALTNVARHAPGAPTRVVLRYRPDGLDIEVANGPAPGGARPAGPGPASGGRGVRGMRERAELYGGRLDARPGPGGGFAVTAAIPGPESTGPEPA